ncbi:hypothetical protein GDO86_003338 [Hymenochirus boettgeri]|uniref:Uncharacterized protein n=1 Tax=Hymenochirus boettgeri TaxID=247094 RepID=A0A8T2K0G5_9PIPI|nr:hypothetical protein GDO86_003338 [Hymenochirus boettgeri]
MFIAWHFLKMYGKGTLQIKKADLSYDLEALKSFCKTIFYSVILTVAICYDFGWILCLLLNPMQLFKYCFGEQKYIIDLSS